MMAPSLSFISETSHSSSFRFVPAISRQLDKTITFTPHTLHLRMRSLHVHVATQRWRVQSTLPLFLAKARPTMLAFRLVLLLYIICQLAHSANIAHALTVNLDQLGTPTTLSAADVIQNRAKQWGVLYTDGEVHALSFII